MSLFSEMVMPREERKYINIDIHTTSRRDTFKGKAGEGGRG